MTCGGVFAVARSIFDHELFAGEEFSSREAWIWLVSEAAWKPRRVKAGKVMVSIERGEVAHSIRFMAEAWGWHRARVERFLNRLKTETMIETRAETGVTVISLCNYAEFQRVALPSKTESETPVETAARQKRDRLEDRENIQTSSLRSDVRAPAKPTPLSELSSVLDEERAKAVIEHRKKTGKPLTAYAAKLLAGKFGQCQDPNAAADAMIANGWQGFEPEWMARQTTPRSQSPPPWAPQPVDHDRMQERLARRQREMDEQRGAA